MHCPYKGIARHGFPNPAFHSYQFSENLTASWASFLSTQYNIVFPSLLLYASYTLSVYGSLHDGLCNNITDTYTYTVFILI